MSATCADCGCRFALQCEPIAVRYADFAPFRGVCTDCARKHRDEQRTKEATLRLRAENAETMIRIAHLERENERLRAKLAAHGQEETHAG